MDTERSVLLALQALKQADTLEARNALHQALPELHLLRTLPPHNGGAPDVAFSPDGSRIASIGAFGRVHKSSPRRWAGLSTASPSARMGNT